ncbi:hypothetical protein ABZ851_25185 [Streptomyces sp. NPDC047049]|uniref:hypothetical protein n=1 Tax=Streptomyces sp. NPDC047049 TaxID=3156688 RepID=UPI0033DE92C7
MTTGLVQYPRLRATRQTTHVRRAATTPRRAANAGPSPRRHPGPKHPWGTLSGLALFTGAVRVLNRRPRDARVVGTLSLVSVLATVGGWLAFQHVVAHGEIDVTGSVRIQRTQPLDGETNRSLTFLLDAPP